MPQSCSSTNASTWPARSATGCTKAARSAGWGKRRSCAATWPTPARRSSRRSGSSPSSGTRRSRPSASSRSRVTEDGERGAQLLGAALAARERAAVTAVAIERALQTRALALFEGSDDAIRDGRLLTLVDAALLAGVEPALVCFARLVTGPRACARCRSSSDQAGREAGVSDRSAGPLEIWEGKGETLAEALEDAAARRSARTSPTTAGSTSSSSTS